ncbi:hypothetical protein [Streptomyces sp. NBC_01180]|uniref:hypothetical protein n=1 Tax=Streptomyces sp. NBC_01180 TaxID=2903763 RepID=UPI0038643025|nr:hypothetical protein OG708_09050 [Streptomyces sp. NBC_01180]
MAKALDTIIGTVLDSMRKARLVESGTLSGTVSAVAADGTITVTRNSDTFPRVRLIGSMNRPAVGDTVMITTSLGGWVCIGVTQRNVAPRIQTGKVITPTSFVTGSSPAAYQWVTATATFAVPFAATPTVVCTPVSTISGTSNDVAWTVQTVTTASFAMRSRRTQDSVTTFGYIATDY